MTTNRDLQSRRTALRPRRSQGDMCRALCELTGKTVSTSTLSLFENGVGDEVGNGITRREYERVLTQWERESRRTLGGSK